MDKEIIQWQRGVSLTKIIRSNLRAYSEDIVIAREFIQNAEDAEATRVWFQFLNDRLIIGNDSVFKPEDFQNILDYGSAGKSQVEGKIGDFGIGFTSAYHLCDVPILCSSGIEVEIPPKITDTPPTDSKVIEHTEFHLIYRTQLTELACELEARPVTPERINFLFDELIQQIPLFIIFLHHIRQIIIEKQEMQALIQKKLENTPHGDSWLIRTTVSKGNQTISETENLWYLYEGKVDKTGFKNKKRPLCAIAIHSEPAVCRELPHTLYNFLPTAIQTGFCFLISGDFWAQHDRRSILMDENQSENKAIQTDSEYILWNHQVIKSIAKLFCENIESIRNIFDERSHNFYDVLPIKDNQLLSERIKQYPIFKPIIEEFYSYAKGNRGVRPPIVYSSQKCWQTADEVKLCEPGLQELLIEAGVSIVHPHLRRHWNFLIDIGVEQFKLTPDLVQLLNERIPKPIKLSEAPSFINTREKLYRLYDYLDRYSNLNSVQEKLWNLNIFLSNDEILCSLDLLYLADEDTRALLVKAYLPIIDIEVQEKYIELLRNKLGKEIFNARKLVETLRDWSNGQTFPRPLNQCHSLINTEEKIPRILQYLDKHSDAIDDVKRARLPLCLGMNKYVYRCGDQGIYCADFRIREFIDLEETEYTFVDKGLQGDYSNLLIKLGCQDFQLPDFIKYLENIAEIETNGDTAPFPLNSIDSLCRLYSESNRQLNRCESRHRQTLIERLKALPIYLSEKGDLRAITDTHNPLFLASEGVPDVLELDSLLSPKILDGNLRQFFEKTIAVETLTDEKYIETYVTQDNYEKLDDSKKLILLDFVRMTDAKYKGISRLDRLKSIPLIHCADNKYRKPGEVFFPSQLLDSIFVQGYPIPHAEYKIPKEENRQRESSWFSLFSRLGVKCEPLPKDLLEAIRRITQTPPMEESVEQLRPIYEYLNENWRGKLDKQAAEFSSLKYMIWLPAENDNSRYYAPNELYPVRLRNLARTHGKFLRFGEPNANFRDFLGMPANAKTEDIVGYLLDLSKNPPADDEKPNYREIYRVLNDRLKSPEDQRIIDQLLRKAIIWDEKKNKFWQPHRVFMNTKLVSDFGHYRGYLDPEGLKVLFIHLGVKETASTEDYVEFIEELAQESQNKTLTEDQQTYIKNAYRFLAKENSGIVSRLKGVQSALGRDGCLHHPDGIFIEDKPRPLEYFEKGNVPLVAEGLGEDLISFLHKELGVHKFSRAVKRHLVDCKDETPLPGFAENRILQRKLALQRCIKTMIENHLYHESDFASMDELDNVNVYGVHDLEIQYIVYINGIDVTSDTISNDAFFDSNSKKLYLQHVGKSISEVSEESYRALAAEMMTVLNPDIKTPPPWIPHEIFKFDNLEEVHQFLDKENYPIIEQETEVKPKRAPNEQGDVIIYKNDESVGQTDSEPQTHLTPELTSEPSTTPQLPQSGLVTSVENTKKPAPSPPPQTPKVPSSKPAPTDISQPKLPPKLDKTTIPPFSGDVSLQSPRGRDTQWWELMRRFGLENVTDDALQAEVSEMKESGHSEEEIRQIIQASQNESPVDEARFVLKYVNIVQGFLPLTVNAQRLLLGRDKVQRQQVMLYTYDESESFPLYVDWNNGIIYNQEKLPAYFQAEDLPAGAIVYLKRRGNTQEEFILHFNRLAEPKIVKEVQILFSDDEKGTFERYTIEEVEIHVETQEMIFRGEKRFEDQYALWLASVGRKNTFETIIDVLEQAEKEGRSKLHRDEIFMRVFLTKMVSQATVHWQLEKRDCFVDEGDGYYRLEPQGLAKEFEKRWRVRMPPSQPPPSPPKPQVDTTDIPTTRTPIPPSATDSTMPPTDGWQSELRQFLEKWISASVSLRELITFVRESWNFLAQASRIKDDELSIEPLIEQIHQHPDSPELAQRVARFLNASLSQFQEGKWTDDDAELIDKILASANEQVRQRHLLPPLQNALDTCRASHDYESAEILAQLLVQYEPLFDNDDLQKERESWEVYMEAQDETELNEKLNQLELALDLWKHEEALNDLKESLSKRIEVAKTAIAELIENNPDEALRQFEQTERLCERFVQWIPKEIELKELSLNPLRLQLQKKFCELVEHYQQIGQHDASFRELLNAGSSLCSRESGLSSEDTRIMQQIVDGYYQRNEIEQAILILRYLIEKRVQKGTRVDSDFRTLLEKFYGEIQLWDECAEVFDGRLSKGPNPWRTSLDSKIAENRQSIREMHEYLAISFESIQKDNTFCRIVPREFLKNQIQREKQKAVLSS